MKKIVSKILEHKNKVKYVMEALQFILKEETKKAEPTLITQEPQVSKEMEKMLKYGGQSNLMIKKDIDGNIQLYNIFGGFKEINQLVSLKKIIDKLCAKYEIDLNKVMKNPSSFERKLNLKMNLKVITARRKNYQAANVKSERYLDFKNSA